MIRLGMITPSSNTVLEPMTARMLHPLPDITAHFARIRVTRIDLTPASRSQFDPTPVLEAASLLADAQVDVIAWNGTSASWLGFETDEHLCAAITAATGIPATSSVIGVNQVLRALGGHTIGLVTPYTGDVQQRIAATYAAAGHPVVAERHLDDPGNFSFANYREPELADLIRDVATARPDAIVALCTNMRATALADGMERETGIPVLDSIAVTLWAAMVLAGAEPARVQGWGRLFATLPQGTTRAVRL